MSALKNNVTYLGDLMKAGWNGLTSAQPAGDGVRTRTRAATLIVPVVVGAGIGMITASLRKRARLGRGLAAASIVGSVVGLGAGAAWTARGEAAAAARSAIRGINAARDAHWLERNPIAYA
jgi:hypothetical protein